MSVKVRKLLKSVNEKEKLFILFCWIGIPIFYMLEKFTHIAAGTFQKNSVSFPFGTIRDAQRV
jgi:ribose 5-phosphate isomerase RpiB